MATLLEVLDGGLLSTIQDAGRPDWAHIGVPESGAADPWSLAVANLLVGNEPGAAAVEMTLVGPTLEVRAGAGLMIGLAGADLGARIRGGRRLAPGRSHHLAGGDVIEVPGDDRNLSSTNARTTGARAYLAIPGGVDVPVVLGSRSTCLPGAFGGFDGRVLRAGDTIGALAPEARGSVTADILRADHVWPEDPDGHLAGSGPGIASLRVIPGPAPGLEALVERQWRVAAAADRVGVRLDGDRLHDGIGGEATTVGVPWGAIQVPFDGRPIVLGPDHQATGGYRVVGVVISADLPVLGQLRPGATVRVLATDRDTALVALRERRMALVAGSAALREAAGWGALTDSAGA